MMGLKGLASAMKPKGDYASKPEPEEAKESDGGGSEMEFAKLASEASAAGDHEAAAKAMVSAIKACMTSYGGKE